MGSPKLSYASMKIYSYDYSVKSRIELYGVEGGVSETDWSARVEMTWIRPCDMVIFLKEYKVEGATGECQEIIYQLK